LIVGAVPVEANGFCGTHGLQAQNFPWMRFLKDHIQIFDKLAVSIIIVISTVMLGLTFQSYRPIKIIQGILRHPIM
jgi:hypothetical protein